MKVNFKATLIEHLTIYMDYVIIFIPSIKKQTIFFK